ncbi:unnamed protein product [[Actinomadura] parvosata subsp. kistnae]|uniref:hypothetical protein n=1 Tax=[Actinomadura] parvosata TaxID=1955412 RepID=UPI000D29B0BD|nr:hypothetical protein [Nonomuraea sp. ATCC 55076]SPL97845.1 unnamed protein product [Actinomadura parvosata subsp. kistnae]
MTDRARLPAGLIAPTLGSFGIGLTEFVIAGLLPWAPGSAGWPSASASATPRRCTPAPPSSWPRSP